MRDDDSDMVGCAVGFGEGRIRPAELDKDLGHCAAPRLGPGKAALQDDGLGGAAVLGAQEGLETRGLPGRRSVGLLRESYDMDAVDLLHLEAS